MNRHDRDWLIRLIGSNGQVWTVYLVKVVFSNM